MESRTTTFEAPPVKDYQTELEEQSSYDYHSDESMLQRGAITVLCTPKKGGVPVRIDYSVASPTTQPEVYLYTVVNLLVAGGASFITTQDSFSYKADVKVSAINPWIAQVRDKHARLCEANRVDAEIGRTAVGRALKLVWEQIRKNLALAHEKKSKRKDTKDSEELF
jgi:hypothetical protein